MKRKTLFVLFLVISSLALHAVSFSSSVLDAQGDMRFSGGFYPVSGKFSYEAGLPDYSDSVSSSLVLNFDVGMKHRLLMQNPEDGRHLDMMSVEEREGIIESSARCYQVQYVYFTLDYELGLITVDYLSSPLFSLVFSLEGDYENAYERLGWLNTDGNEATFTKTEGGKRGERFSSYSGVAELEKDSLTGYRQLSHTGIKFRTKFNYSEETRMTKDGIWADISVSYMPSWFPLHDNGSSSYLSIRAEAAVAFTLLNVSQFSISSSSDALKMFTLVLESESDFRFVTGKGIPQYALERSVWGSHTASSAFIAANTTKLVLRGPQFMEDVYPSLSLMNDAAYSFGPVANGEGSINSFSGSISLRAEADILDTLYLFAECGYVYASLHEADKGFVYSLGVKLGI